MNSCPLNSRGRARPRSAGVPDVPWEPVVIWGQTSHGEVGTGDLGPCGEAEARRWGRAASQAVVDARSRPAGGQRPALSCQTAGRPGRAPPQRVPVRSRRGLKLGLAWCRRTGRRLLKGPRFVGLLGKPLVFISRCVSVLSWWDRCVYPSHFDGGGNRGPVGGVARAGAGVLGRAAGPEASLPCGRECPKHLGYSSGIP